MKRITLLATISFVLIFCATLFLSEKACEYALGNHPVKPIPFNHKTHLTEYDAGPECEVCHQYYDNGRFMGIPSVADCLMCHENTFEFDGTDNSADQHTFEIYNDTDIPWDSYAKQPDHVYFSHLVVMSSELEDKPDCETCHGPKSESTDTAMIKGKMLMPECMECHDNLKISNKCAVCHD